MSEAITTSSSFMKENSDGIDKKKYEQKYKENIFFENEHN